MHETWLDRGVGPQDVQAALQALALQADRAPPLFAALRDDAGRPRILFADHALFDLFTADGAGALSARLFGGADPGAKRLAALFEAMPLDGAPRLERLRFFLGPGTEVITVLCRRMMRDSHPLFVAAILNPRAGLLPDPARPRGGSVVPAPAPPDREVPREMPEPAAAGGGAAALQADLRRRWPASRTLRFLWQTDADLRCTAISPPLAEVVGTRTADLVGRSLLEVAPRLDPTGRFAAHLRARETWSGLDLHWPLTDAPASILVTAGAIPTFDADRAFEGFRGFGVIHLDRVTAAEPMPFPSTEHPASATVLPFPGAKPLSLEEETAFREIGATLREAGPGESDPVPSDADPVQEQAPLPATGAADPQAAGAGAGRRDDGIGRNGLAVLDRLGLGLLVTRDSVPIFANRHLLDLLDFADEDALHEVGGMTHLLSGLPAAAGGEAVGVRNRHGTVMPASARMQVIEWDGLPATLLTLRGLDKGRPEHGDNRRDGDGRRDDSETRELRAILETATDGVAVLNAAGTILSLNRSGEALFGCDRAAVVGQPFLALFAPHNQGLAADYLEGLKSSATRSLLNDGRELLVQAHQGGTIPVFMTLGRLGPSLPANGAEPRFCALFRDLTHWKKAEQELDEARREAERVSARKSDFLTKVSHEVRTPLNAIIGFAEVMMDERLGPLGNPRYKDYLKDIHSSGTHVMSLVNDLLDLSKIEAGKMELNAVALDANAVVTECVGIMQPQASRERVIMRLSLANKLPAIRADERSLRQIVLNLLCNAVKFNEPGGQVIVATALSEAGQIVVRIRDTGPGMSDADVVAALEPFRQLSGSRPMAGGAGLGLPLTKALVEANQASLTIRSKLDQGTLVEVAFPPAQVVAQ